MTSTQLGIAQQASTLPDEPSSLSLLSGLLRHRGIIVGMGVVAFAVVVGVGMLAPRTYTSTLSFLPQVRRAQTGGLSGIAAQFGLTAADGEPGQSPTFYGDLVVSSEILRGLVETRYWRVLGGRLADQTLIDVYNIASGTPAQRRDAAMKRLKQSFGVDVNGKTGVVSVSVVTQNPSLSQAIGQRLLQLLAQFNQQRRQSQATAERQFVQQRMAEAHGELSFAEDNLQDFLLRNREYRNSTTLTFQVERLNREVTLRQQLYNSLAQAYDQAKVEEVRDTPLLTIVEPASLPSRADGRGLIKKGILALIFGLVVGAFVAAGRETLTRARIRRDPRFDELSSLFQESMEDVKQPWRPILRRFRPNSAPRKHSHP